MNHVVWLACSFPGAPYKGAKEMGKTLTLTAALLTAFGIGTTAASAGTITVSLGSGPNLNAFDTATIGATSGSFESLYGPATWTTGSSASFATDTSAADKYLQPAGDGTTYIFATTGSDATVSFADTVTSIDIYWGSPDTFNTITLSNGDSITGSAVLALTGTPTGDNAGTAWITITDEAGFDGFTATSTRPAFEFDMAAVPEASTWAMMSLGFAALGFAGFRGRRTSISIA